MATYFPDRQSLDPLGLALGQGLGQGIQGAILSKDLQAVQGMGQMQRMYESLYGGTGLQVPQAQMPQMRSPMGQQMMMQSTMPMTQYQKAMVSRPRSAPRSYQVSWFDREGKKKSALVPEDIYGEFQEQIETKGGTLNEPDSLQDQYRYWQEALRRARGTDTATTQSRILAEATGQKLQITRDVEGEELALDKLKEIRAKMAGKAKRNVDRIPTPSAGRAVGKVTPPKPKKIYGKPNKIQFMTTYKNLKTPEEKQRFIDKYWRPEFGQRLE